MVVRAGWTERLPKRGWKKVEGIVCSLTGNGDDILGSHSYVRKDRPNKDAIAHIHMVDGKIVRCTAPLKDGKRKVMEAFLIAFPSKNRPITAEQAQADGLPVLNADELTAIRWALEIAEPIMRVHHENRQKLQGRGQTEWSRAADDVHRALGRIVRGQIDTQDMPPIPKLPPQKGSNGAISTNATLVVQETNDR